LRQIKVKLSRVIREAEKAREGLSSSTRVGREIVEGQPAIHSLVLAQVPRIQLEDGGNIPNNTFQTKDCPDLPIRMGEMEVVQTTLLG
jgi:hypothetical protein